MASAELASGLASARAALAGNPSDGYGGAVLAVTLSSQRARTFARPAEELEIIPHSALIEATVLRFARELTPAAERTSIEWSTNIPRGVGLAGSSALVIATLRALASLYSKSISASDLADLALAVEVEELGIAAGPQDRVAQAYGGLTFMDFATGDYERLTPQMLPPTLVAWRQDAASESNGVHTPLRERHERGEPEVLEAMEELGELAREARRALLGGDRGRMASCVDGSFDARQRILTLDPRHVRMIEAARAAGASANYAGSGGAIVAVCPGGDAHRAEVARALGRMGCAVMTA